jgi:hypothetical protein
MVVLHVEMGTISRNQITVEDIMWGTTEAFSTEIFGKAFYRITTVVELLLCVCV